MDNDNSSTREWREIWSKFIICEYLYSEWGSRYGFRIRILIRICIPEFGIQTMISEHVSWNSIILEIKWLRWVSIDLQWDFQSKSRFGLNLEQNLHSRVLDPKDYLRIYNMKFYDIENLSDWDEYLSISSEIFSQNPDLDWNWSRICIPEFWIQRIISQTAWLNSII